MKLEEFEESLGYCLLHNEEFIEMRQRIKELEIRLEKLERLSK